MADDLTKAKEQGYLFRHMVVLVNPATGLPYAVDGGGGSADAALTTTQNALSVAAEVVIAANAARRFADIRNTDASIIIYWGKDNTLTVGNGYPVYPRETYIFDDYIGPIWAIAASGTPIVATAEW